MKIIGHRGARGLAPENTLVALEKAIEHGVDAIEFDVRVTKDNIVVLHHDHDLVDPSGNHLEIYEHNLGELRTHKPDLATLEEAIHAINHRAKLLIEVKPGVVIQPVVQIIENSLRQGWKLDEITCCSFSFHTLQQIKKSLPEMKIMIIDRWSGVRASRRARQLGTKLISMNQRWLWWGFIKSMKSGGYELYAYTLNNPAKAKRWSKYGLAGVITDYPDLFQK